MKCFHCDGDTIKTEHEDFDERFNEKYTRLTKLLCIDCGAHYNVYLPTEKKYLTEEED
jgi:hypothetical protein|tara:strand:- start:303 stop:476 length:174 start_codon:yes stop_codon:yes gene_type:complete